MKTVDQKRQESKVRDEAAKNRTPEEQLRRLDEKFGVGVGAKRERERLKQRIQSRQKAKKEEREQTVAKKEYRDHKRREKLERDKEKEESVQETEELEVEEDTSRSARPRKLGRSMKKRKTK